MRSTVAFALAAVLVTAGCSANPGPSEPASPPAAASSSAPPASPGETPAGSAVLHSDNVTHVANVPPRAPLDGPQAWGTDLAFQGDHAFVGNFDGFTVFDVSDPAKPRIVSQVLCPGEQNDVSVTGNLLFLSIDMPRGGPGCDDGEQTGEQGWEGIRIFDITDKAHPKFVSAVSTSCGSHTHTLVPGKTAETVYLYISSAARSPGTRAAPARTTSSPSSRSPPAIPPRPRSSPSRGSPTTPGRAPRWVSAAATTSPSTRRRTWPRPPASVTASCWTSPTR
nr:hypothetical protein GCM10020093_032980 [Planobispora longispora]